MVAESAIIDEVNDGTGSSPAVHDPTSTNGVVAPTPAQTSPSSLSTPTDTTSPVETNTCISIAPLQPLPKPIKLYKSTRLKGYMTLFLASFINYDSAQKSSNVDINLLHVVPSNDDQRKYAVAVAVVSLIASGFCLVAHLDRITPLERLWIFLFQPSPPPPTVDPPTAAPNNLANHPNTPTTNTTTDGKANDTTATTATSTPSISTLEGTLALFLTIWWSIATGVATAVSGMAGDGKGQYSLYYSYWACTCTSYWILERCGVAAGWVRVV
jgi:hypothetical protein